MAALVSAAIVATFSVALPQAAALPTGPAVAIAAVTDADGPTAVPVTLTGFGQATSVVAVVSLPAESGSLAIDPAGLAITLEFGYEAWSGRRSIGFRGPTADVAAALAGLVWNAPLSAAPVPLTVAVSEYAPGTFYDSATGHYYEPVTSSSAVSWAAARTAAAASTRFGQTGYLATVTSRAENAFISDYVAADNLWIGASDATAEGATEGAWRWVTGPEAGTPFWNGTAGGSRVADRFSSWAAGEPNNSSNEHYAGTNFNGVKGKWNDFSATNSAVKNYLVEYGGLAGQSSTALAATATATLAAAPAIVVQPVAVRTSTADVAVSVTLPRVDTSSDLVAVVSLPEGGGTLSLAGAQGLTPEFGYPTVLTGQRSLGVRGTATAVREALASGLRWTAPETAGPVALSVSVGERVSGYFYNPVNGHYYEPVTASNGLSFGSAKTAAAGQQPLRGMSGYLATLTSAQENTFVATYVDGSNIWIGASDDHMQINPVADIAFADQAASEGRWHWVSGPEAGTRFWTGAANGSVVAGQFASWVGGSEPNNTGGEHYAATNYQGGRGLWNDFPASISTVGSYLVEYGGMPDEVSTVQQAATTATLTALSALAVFQDHAQTDTGLAPTADDYSAIGQPGLSSTLVGAVNSVLASLPFTGQQVTTEGAVHDLVDAYQRVLVRAGGGWTPLQRADLLLLGLTPPATEDGLGLLDAAATELGTSGVDTVAELQALADVAHRVTTAPEQVTLDDLAALGLTVYASTEIDLVRFRLGQAGPGLTWGELQSWLTADAEAIVRTRTAHERITAYAQIDTGDVPSLGDLNDALGLHPGLDDPVLMAAVNSALAGPNVRSSDVDDVQELQGLVDAYARILARSGDGTDPVTADDLHRLGARTLIDMPIIASTIGLIDGARAAGALTTLDVDTAAELQALLLVADRVSAADPELTLDDLAALGLTVYESTLVSDVVDHLGAQTRTWTEVQAFIDQAQVQDARVLQAQERITAYADLDTGEAPTLAELHLVLSPDATSTEPERAVLLSVLAATTVTGQDVDSPAELQSLLDAYRRVLARAGGGLTLLTYEDLTLLELPMNSAVAVDLLDEAARLWGAAFVDTHAELQAMAAAAQRVAAYQSMSLDDLDALGLTLYRSTDVTAVRTYVAGRQGDVTWTGLQTFVTEAATAAAAAERIRTALQTIQAYAQIDTGAVPTLADLDAVLDPDPGLTDQELSAVTSALASTAVTAVHVDTGADLQLLVDAYRTVLDRAGSGGTPVTADDLALLGTSLPGSAQQLFDGALAAGTPAAVDTAAELAALAAIITRLHAGAAGVTAADLAALGFEGVTAGNLGIVLAGLPADGSSLTWSLLSDLVGDGLAGAGTALATLGQYAASKTGTPPSAGTYAAAGITGAGTVLDLVNSALAAPGLGADDADTATEIQQIVDAATAVLAWVDGTGSPLVSDEQLGSLGAAGAAALDDAQQTFLHGVLHDGLHGDPSLTVPVLEAAAGSVLRALSDPSALTLGDLSRLGVTGATAANLGVLTTALGAQLPTDVADLRTIAAAAVLAAQTDARALLAGFDGTGQVPVVADYANAGVVGVTDVLLDAVNSVLAERDDLSVPQDVQVVVEAYARVLATAADPLHSPAVTVQDLLALGLTGVDAGNLTRVIAALAATDDDGSGVTPVSALRTLVAAAVHVPPAPITPVTPVVTIEPEAGASWAEAGAELPDGTLSLRFEGVTVPGVLDVTTGEPSVGPDGHLVVGDAVTIAVGELAFTSVQLCLPVVTGALPANLSLGEVRLYQIVDGTRVDVTGAADHGAGAVCGTADAVGEFVLGTPTVVRRAGADRYATSTAASAARFAPGVPVVYLASGATFADALAGGTGVAALGGPVLLVGPGQLPAVVADELARLQPGRIVVLGGPAAVPAGLDATLARYTSGAVVRIAGADRYATAAAAARDAFPGGARTVYVASGQSFADAVGGGSAAAADGAPLLLTAPGALPAATRAEITRLGADRVVLLGGPAVVSDAVVEQLSALGVDVTRRQGADRYGTAAAAALAAFPAGADVVYLATGAAFADALSAVPVSADSRAPVLLVAADRLPLGTAAALRTLAPARIVVLGGTAAVAPAVLADVQQLLDAG